MPDPFFLFSLNNGKTPFLLDEMRFKLFKVMGSPNRLKIFGGMKLHALGTIVLRFMPGTCQMDETGNNTHQITDLL